MTKQETIAYYFSLILKELGYDLSLEHIKETPERYARFLLDFLVNFDAKNNEKTFNVSKLDQLVIVKNIPFYSLCSHHVLPFFGHVNVGYLTGSKVIGLSKIPRIVKKHSHKLQVQENLAEDIAQDLERILDDCNGVIVIISATHTCMNMRGVESEGQMVNSAVTGQFLDDDSLEQKFIQLLNI